MFDLHHEHRGVGPFDQLVDRLVGSEGHQPDADPDIRVHHDGAPDRVEAGGGVREVGPGHPAYELVTTEPDDRVERAQS